MKKPRKPSSAALVNDALWAELAPLLPAAKPRRAKQPGRQPLEPRRALEGILFVLRTGIGWNALPQSLGFGCGSACHKRLSAWAALGVWEALHRALVARLEAAGQIDWRRAVVDSSSVRAVFGGIKPALTPRTGVSRAASITCSATRGARRSARGSRRPTLTT